MSHRAAVEVSCRSGAILGWDREAFEANRQAEIAYWFRGRKPEVPRYTDHRSWIGFSNDWHNTNAHYVGRRK